jgi:DNA-binding MarR family transcriptional regulator
MNETIVSADVESPSEQMPTEEALAWLEMVLPRIMRRLMDAENLDMPLFQLPLAQMRLAYALYGDPTEVGTVAVGETMGRLSERLGVRQNALTQAADRLVRHELAERLSDPSDRRVVRLRLTATGAAWVRERRDRRHQHLASLWAELDATERDSFLHAVNVLRVVTERLNARSEEHIEGNSLPRESSEQGEPARRELPTVEETLARFTAGAANGAAARILELRAAGPGAGE